MNYRAFPPEFWKKIRTTNLLERVHKELKRRSRKIGAFPNDASLLRLAGSILIDINEEWITGNRYLSTKSEMISLDTGCSEFTANCLHYQFYIEILLINHYSTIMIQQRKEKSDYTWPQTSMHTRPGK
jgi:hypothetical protein